MEKKKKYVKCSHCNGSGKVPKMRKVRQWCDECGDKGHGCFGSGKNKKGREQGHPYCIKHVQVYET